MQTGPKVKLTVDLHKIDRYFPLDFNSQGVFDYEMIIDRQRYDEVEALLGEFDISDPRIIQEFCFIILWIKREIHEGDERDNYSGKYYQMRFELDNLKHYLVKHRITAITFHGEYERNKPGKTLTMREETNIDRICDGLRSIFRKEFSLDSQKKKKSGLRDWKRKKMMQVKNNLLNYLETIPRLDSLALDDQNNFIDKLSELAGLPI